MTIIFADMSELLFKDKITKLKEFEKDTAWYRGHHKYLKQKHGGRYVAIRNSKVVLWDVDQDRLLAKLRQARFKDKTFVIKYVSKRDMYPAP